MTTSCAAAVRNDGNRKPLTWAAQEATKDAPSLFTANRIDSNLIFFFF